MRTRNEVEKRLATIYPSSGEAEIILLLLDIRELLVEANRVEITGTPIDLLSNDKESNETV